MLYEFSVYQMKVEDHLFWVAESKSLKGCVGQGDSSEEAVKELEENEKEWLNTAKEFGIPIPPRTVKKPKTYSGKVSLRMSPYVHESAAEAARLLGISTNQFINDAIIKYTAEVESSSKSVASQAPDTETSSRLIKFPVPAKSPFAEVQEELEEM